MQSEDFDKKIRDAADHHHPAYNEKAWSKMEGLLNTHLPEQKRDRRGFILFLLAFVVLGGATWMYFDKPWQPKQAVANNDVHVNEQKTSEPATPTSITKEGQSRTIKPSTPEASNKPATFSEPANSKLLPGKNSSLVTDGQFETTTTAPPKAKRAKKQAASTTDVGNKPAIDEMNVTADVIIPGTVKSPPTVSGETKSNPELINNSQEKVAAATPAQPLPPATTSVEEKPIDKAQPNEEVANPREKKAKGNSLAVSFSAGPDISAVGTDDWGKVQPVLGVGIAYTFKERFTIRTGFYTASKIYTAKPDEYKNSPSFPNYNYLNRIDADCKVYEIPLTFAYNFGATKNHNWFASTGLSSYIMKKETYDYVYKYNNGTTYTHQTTYNNENTNLFSVLSVSGGYTRKLSKTFSLSAEPYLKLPLSGVGAGSVQLNSAGVLVTISARIR